MKKRHLTIASFLVILTFILTGCAKVLFLVEKHVEVSEVKTIEPPAASEELKPPEETPPPG